MPAPANRSLARQRRRRSRLRGPTTLLLISLLGCSSPDRANIVLRKHEQELSARLETLKRQHEGDVATIESLQQRTGSLSTLSYDRLQRLFTTHGLKLGRLTGGANLDRSRPGDEGLRIYAVPIDETGGPLKAAGAFTVDAYDVSRDERPRIGHWTFDLAQSREQWRGVLNQYTYVLTCPWQTPPTRPGLHVEVTFLDELTQREFKQTLDVTVEPPAGASSTAPASNPAVR